MVLKENEQKALFELKQTLGGRYRLLDFRLFGSKAKGLDVAGSDIDVMIELEVVTPQIELEIANLVFDTNLANDCFVSTVIFSRKELEEGPLDQSPLYKAIQKDGIAL